jgi:acetyl-CoA carboxylase biotin carboxyl carrier protein
VSQEVVPAVSETKPEESIKESAKNIIPEPASISAFMTQVADLIELVDSRDITELQLKQDDCEIRIRKKEAFAQTAPPAQYVMAQSPPPQQYAPAPAAQAPAAPAPAAAPAGPKSSHPPLKSPMAGTFYRCPAPGTPPFIKVGDKVQKGQVLCIIEAMKLMNDIEADRSGTLVEILVDDAKPVSFDTVSV